MDKDFIDILKMLVAERGKVVLTDAKKCKALLADYTKNEYKKDSRLLVQAVEAGVAKKIDKADNLIACKKTQIKELKEEYHIDQEAAENVVSVLALVLRRDTPVMVSQFAEKPTIVEKSLIEKTSDRSHSKKTATLPNGDVYEGDLIGNKKHGKGKLTIANGNVYEGDFIDDDIHGKGKYTFANGDIYEGNFVDGKLHGKGKSTFADGDMYEGDFANGKLHGKGKYTYAKGIIYEGDFVDDMLHGKGKKTFPDGNFYEGNFVEGKQTCKGKFTWTNGEVYEGDFVGDEQTG
jgi:hypothetical protein